MANGLESGLESTSAVIHTSGVLNAGLHPSTEEREEHRGPLQQEAPIQQEVLRQ